MGMFNGLIFSALAMGGIAAVSATMMGRTTEAGSGQPVRQVAAVQAHALPQTQAPARGGMVVLEADRRGHYHGDLLLNGVVIEAMVDTGASVVAMSTEDAKRANIRVPGDAPKAQFRTANGIVTATIVRIPELRLQGVLVRDVEASIMPPGSMQGTLLGMSFLKKLASFEIRGNTLVLKQ
jgi:aspartyl protease family protein